MELRGRWVRKWGGGNHILNWFCFLFCKPQETKKAPRVKQDRRAGGWKHHRPLRDLAHQVSVFMAGMRKKHPGPTERAEEAPAPAPLPLPTLCYSFNGSERGCYLDLFSCSGPQEIFLVPIFLIVPEEETAHPEGQRL